MIKKIVWQNGRMTESIYDQNDSIKGLNKSKLKESLSLATKESYFIFNEILYNQIDGVPMGSPLRPNLVNAFLWLMKKVVRTMSW